jgi:5'(3')-deoxyribonucleotidase
MLLLAAIKTASDLGINFEEDSHSLTPAMSRLYDELDDSGFIYGGSGAWAISPSGEGELKKWLREDIKPALPGKLGDCFPVAGRAMLHLEDELETAGYRMVHALVRGEGKLEGRRFGHAFHRLGDVIFDNSNGNKIMTRKENYFKQGSINPNEKGAYVEYNKEQSLLNIVKHGHWGPWDLDESLMEEIPNDPAEVGKRHVSISHNELDKAKNELGGLKEYKIEVPVDKKFNMPRSKMPQVHIDDYPEFFDYLSNAGAVFSKEKVSPKTLKPVQGEFAEKGVIKSIKKLKLEKPVIVSSDNYIIDGHHRWLAALNVNQKVLIYRVSLGANKLMQLVLDFPKTYFKDIYEIATHEVRSKTRSGKRYIDVYLPQGGEDGVMLLRWAGQPDWYKRVELRGTPYTKRPEDSDELWDMFDKLYPSKSSALMADEVTTIGPGQGVYSYGYDDLLKLMTEDITKLREDGVSNYKPKVFVDMDGVLANFFDEWEKLLDVGNWRDIKDPIEALKVLAGTDFFATLPKFPGKTDELVTFVHGITNGNWYILSAPLRWDHKGSIKHKQEWLSKNLPIQPKDAIFTGMKESYAIDKMTGQPNILIDDHSKYIKRWVAKGGIAIQYKAGSDSVEKVKQFLEDQLGTMRKDVEDVEIKEAKVLKEKRIGKITKKKYMVSKRDAVVQKMLSSNISLRNVHAAAEYIDNVIKELTSKTGWTDRKGETHYGHDMYIGKLGIWPPTTQPMIGTPDPYSRNKFKQLMASTQANESAAGIITKQNTTAEVKPGEEERQAAKLGWKLDKNGRPPLLHKTAAKNSDPNTLFNIGLAS